MNLKNQKFLELGNLCLAETPQPDLTRWNVTIDFGKERGFNQPGSTNGARVFISLGFRPAQPYGVKCAY
jgi:hypothetical protein